MASRRVPPGQQAKTIAARSKRLQGSPANHFCTTLGRAGG